MSAETIPDPYPYVWEEHSPYNQMRVDTDMYRKGANGKMSGYCYRPRPNYPALSVTESTEGKP